MTETTRTFRLRRRLTGFGAAAAALTLGLTLAPASPANAGNEQPQATTSSTSYKDVDVMTRNLYLGAGLDEILAAIATGDPATIVGAATQTWNVVKASDPEERMAAIADEIAAARPHVVGLQEVTIFKTYRYNPLKQKTLGRPKVAYNFLTLLLDELEDRGVVYRVVRRATAKNFKSPPIPVLAKPDAVLPTKAVTLADRDVILRRYDVKAWNGRNGNFTNVLQPPAVPLKIDRGWGSADVLANHRVFRFVNSHTEAAGPEEIRVAQVLELFAAQDAITAKFGELPTVYVGDYNSKAPTATTPAENGYLALRTRLDDAWSDANPTDPGFTCCQNATLTNPTSQLDERIDLILTSDEFEAKSAYLTGITPIDLPGTTWWASDHAGVVARLALGDNY